MIYRVFIKYCVFSLKCCDYSDFCRTDGSNIDDDYRTVEWSDDRRAVTQKTKDYLTQTIL